MMTDWGSRTGSGRARILVDLADEITPVFTIIFQSSLTQGDVPDDTQGDVADDLKSVNRTPIQGLKL